MILVMGATGQNGREVVRELVSRGAPVRAASRSGARGDDGAAESVAFDYADPGSVDRALDGAERVFVVSPDPHLEENVATRAAKAGVKHIVKLSVWQAGEQDFTFARWHRRIESLIEESGVPYTFLRPNSFMQNVVNYLGPSIKAGSVFYEPAGDSRVAHVDVRDVARAAAAVLTAADEHAGQAYDLSGAESLTYRDIAETLTDVLGREIRYIDPGEAAYKETMVGLGAPEPYADALVDLNRYFKTGKGAEPTPWIERLSGRKPTAFRAFAEEHAAALS
jgi:uncharacterized protein YbjT (DUF2867 family)